MPSCSVKWCSNHTSTCSLKSKNGVSFHRFPKDESMCKKWVEAVRFERRDPWWNSSNASRICSIHFKKSDISSTPCKVNILEKTAVPVCTMVWYDDNENIVTLKPSIERTNTDKIILKTYERKKTNMNVLQESKVNMSYNWNKDETMTKTNRVVISNTTSCNLFQDNVSEATKIIKSSELKEGLEPNSTTNKSLKTIANKNANPVQKKIVLTEFNKQESIKYCTDNCCKSDVHVKLNDNTSLILDEDLNNDGDTTFKEFNKVSKEPNTRVGEISKKINLLELKSNENIEPNLEVNNISKSDTFIETITNGNAELDANISKSFVGKMLRTYLPKRKDKINEKNIRETYKLRIKNKDKSRPITTERRLNTVKGSRKLSKEANNTNVNKYLKYDFCNFNTGIFIKNNIMADLQSKKSSQEINKLYASKNVKKYFFERKSTLLNQPITSEHNKTTVSTEPHIVANTESNISIDEFISNQTRINSSKETDTEVYDEIISELFETSKNVGNVSDTPSDRNYQETNENQINSVIEKGTNNMHVILDLDTNVYTESNTLMDLELFNGGNMELKDGINTKVNTGKTAINENATLFNENTPTESIQQQSIMNKYMTSESHHNLYTEIKKKIPNQDHSAEFNKCKAIEVNDLVTSLQGNIDNDAANLTNSNVKKSSLEIENSISFEEFITNISPDSNDSQTIDLNTNFNTEPNSTREPKFHNKNMSDINIESNKPVEKDMPNFNSFMNWELCDEVNIGCTDKINTELNTEKKDIDADQYKENKTNESNEQLKIMNKKLLMEHSDHMTSGSSYYLYGEINENNMTQSNKNVCYNDNINSNAIMLSNNKLENVKTSVVSNIVNETRKDKFTELKKYLSMKPKLDSFSALYTNTPTDTDKVLNRDHNLKFDENSNVDVNNIGTSIQNNNNNDTRETESNFTTSKQCFSILNEELITNKAPESNNNENIFVMLKTDPNTTKTALNKHMTSDNNESKKILEKDMPELNAFFHSELNEDQILNSKEVIKRKFNNLNEFNDSELLLQKSDKDFVNVLEMSDDQHTVVNEHLDVVNSILNKDIAAEFDLSLLLSDTPIPDEDIQNVDNNSNYNSLDGIAGSPNWIQLPSGEIPKIIDDIMDQDSPFFENMVLFDKANKLNMDKETNMKDNEIEKPAEVKLLTSNVDQFEKQIISIFCETGKQCAKNSITEIENQLIAELSDYNETSLEQTSNICTENKVIQSKKVTEKEVLKQYLQPTNELCEKNNQIQIVNECNEKSDKEIQCGNKTLNQCQKQNKVDSKTNQIEDRSIMKFIGQYFEQSEKSQRGQDGLRIDNSNNEVLNDVTFTFELSMKQNDKQSIEQTNQTSVGKLIAMKESVPNSKILNQGTLGSSFQEINKQLSKDFNKERIEEVHKVFKETHTKARKAEGTEIRPELNIGKLKRVIFEECYDTECRNNCKHQKNNSYPESHKDDAQLYKKATNYNPYGVFNKQQCDQFSIDNSNKQLNVRSSDQNMKKMRKKDFFNRHKLSQNEIYKTKYKKIAIGHIPGQFIELRWKESIGKHNTISEKGCKRKNRNLGLDQRKILCIESTNNFSQQTLAECPECGYTTDDNELMNYQSDVDLRITKPLSLINEDMLINPRDRVALKSVYAMELAYITAMQALERKLKQKIAISEYRLRKVNKLTKINDHLMKSITLMDFSQK